MNETHGMLEPTKASPRGGHLNDFIFAVFGIELFFDALLESFLLFVFVKFKKKYMGYFQMFPFTNYIIKNIAKYLL